jgi:hypothetical protein
MQHYQEEAIAFKDLRKTYNKLKELGLAQDEKALNKLYLEMGEQYGRGKLWCERRLKLIQEAEV